MLFGDLSAAVQTRLGQILLRFYLSNFGMQKSDFRIEILAGTGQDCFDWDSSLQQHWEPAL